MINVEQAPEQTNNFKTQSLHALREQLVSRPYPGYPDRKDRLYAQGGSIKPVALPLGPWETSEGTVPSISEQDCFIDAGLETDAYGRPLHPWFWQMYEDPDVGVVTGKGFYWNWGPNYTADAVVVRQNNDTPEILLIQRGDTGAWALPGGFIDLEQAEPPEVAARREAEEETGIRIPPEASAGKLVYQGPLADVRVTAHAWPHTYAYLYDVSGLDLSTPCGDDDAVDARWLPIDACDQTLHGSHGLIIQHALEHYYGTHAS